MSDRKSRKFRIEELTERFKGVMSFTYLELYEFYLEYEPNLKIGAFKWRVHHLKNEGLIRSLKKGVYLFEARKRFTPQVTTKLRNIYKLLRKQFPYMNVTLWDTSWLHEFMIHQPIKSNLIVEVSRESMGSVFTLLKKKNGDVYIEPSRVEIQKYVQSSDGSIVIKPLIVEAPIFLFENVSVPKIEKILVDLFVEEDLFITYQGQEKRNIFENVFNNYSINMSTLFRYASKRRIKEKLINFMKTQTSIHEKYLGV